MKPTTISFFSFLFVSLVLLGGCDRGEPGIEGYITGQVVSVMDRETPVVDAKVVIYRADGCYSSGDPDCWEALDSTITDHNGSFSTSYHILNETDVLIAKGYKDGYFRNVNAVIFGLASSNTQVLMTPKTYFKVHIEDEYPYDYSKYVGMWLSHTTFVPNDTVYQYPMDTTVIVEGNPVEKSGGVYPFNSLGYALIYNRPNTVGSLNVLHNMQCAPFDTCEVWIKF